LTLLVSLKRIITMAFEKDPDVLPPPQAVARPPKQRSNPVSARRIASAILLTIGFFHLLSFWSGNDLFSHGSDPSRHDSKTESLCPQVKPLFPEATNEKLQEMEAFLNTSSFRESSIKRLSEIVQIPSISYDDMGSAEEDPRFDIFYKVEELLESTYPLLHSKLKKELVNVHGLLYTWQGSDESLKPTLLMAHQDVVPVEKSTIDAWTHPPFSGHYDGKYVWGRGSSDCKNQLTAIMETVELLLKADFQPKRTILLSFGFDEEVSGTRGAGALAPFITERYGKDSVAAIVDEGAGVVEAWGSAFGLPAVGEKGYTDVTITVRMPGGHSSIPSDHTSIGVISDFITRIEGERYSPRLVEENPFLGALQCGAKYSPDFPSKLKRLLHHRANSKQGTCHRKKDVLAEEAAKMGLAERYLMQTSQAVDLISGGAKVNALPERVSATVNHRINIGSSSATVHKHLTHMAAAVAQKYNLTLHAFDGKEEAGSISLSASETTLEPAPVTPTTIVDDECKLTPWAILSGSTRAIYGTKINMAPGLSTGNTDTRYYWDVSRHIFRYGPGYEEGETGLGAIHTVNEKQSVTAHINAVKWFATFVRNMDEAEMA